MVLRNLQEIEMNKTKVKMDKEVYLDLSIWRSAIQRCMNIGMII